MNLELDELYLNPKIYIARSEIHRWGVFAREDIEEHEVLQESPYCEFNKKEIKKSQVITRYTYGTTESDDCKDYVLGFGYAALYNHRDGDPNAAYMLDTINQVMRHYATTFIAAGEEICLDYGVGDWGEDDYCV